MNTGAMKPGAMKPGDMNTGAMVKPGIYISVNILHLSNI